VGQSTDSNEIDIGTGNTATGKTQTINVGTVATGTGKSNITIGNTNGASSLNLQAGTGNVNLLTNASTAGVIAKSNTNSATAFVVQNASSVALLTADTSAMTVSVNGDLSIAKRTDSGGTTGDWAKVSGTVGTPCGQASMDKATASAVYNGSLYVAATETGTDKAELCRYDGGTSWTRINSVAAGTFGSQTNTDSIDSMTVFNGYLYFGTTGGGTAGADTGKAAVYRWDGGTTFTLINTTLGQFSTNATATTLITTVTSMVVYKGVLHIGTSKTGAAEVYMYNGGTGASVFSSLNAAAGTFFADTVVNTVTSMVVYNGLLVIGTAKTNAAAVYYYAGDYETDAWDRFSTEAAGNFDTAAGKDEVSALIVYNGQLIASVSDGANAALFKLTEGYGKSELPLFKKINPTAGTFGSQTTVDYVKSMAVYNGSLYVGTQDATTLTGVYRYNDDSTFTLTNTAAGQFASTTGIDGVTTMAVLGDKLYIGTNESNSAEMYSYSRIEGQSRALIFNASSDNAGSTEQASYPNQGSIIFTAESNAASNPQGGTGTFVFSHSMTTSTGAYDVAEDYPTRDDTLKPGDLVSIDPHETGFVRKASGQYDPGLVGVYSEKPALRLSQKDVTINGGRAIPVALAGRVPVAVTGDVAPGDPLTSSSIPGVAMKATGTGRIVGMAMGTHTGADVGSVMSFVNPNYYSGSTDLQSNGAMGDAVVNGTLTTKDLVVTNKATIKTLMVTGEATVGSLTVTGTVTTRSLVATDSVATKDLVVSGSADLTDVTVSGHITTKGDKPVVSAESGAGKDAQVSVDGNDVSGTITVKAGKESAAGNLVKVTFARPYGKAPHVVISPNGSKAAELQAFLGAYSTTEFYVGANAVSAEGQEYKFEYFVTQGE
jgi:hypothetical protein